MENRSACIICGKERAGLPVRNDTVIESIRWVKRNITGSEKRYRLVVCKDDFLAYRKKRASYERREVMYVAMGVLFLVVLTISAHGNLGAIGIGLVITLFLFLLAQLSYMPAVEMPKAAVRKEHRKNRRQSS